MKTAMQEAIEYLKSFNLEASAIILEDKFLQKEKQNMYLIMEQWGKSREAERTIGVLLGIQLGIDHAEEYWNQIDKLQSGDTFQDETEFNAKFKRDLIETYNKKIN